MKFIAIGLGVVVGMHSAALWILLVNPLLSLGREKRKKSCNSLIFSPSLRPQGDEAGCFRQSQEIAREALAGEEPTCSN